MQKITEVKTVHEVIRRSGKRYPYPAIPLDAKPHYKKLPSNNFKVFA